MKPNSLLRAFAILATSAPLLFAQEDGLDLEDLFAEEFEQASTVTIHDPLEKVNRVVFKFNDGLFKHVVRPFSRTYAKVMPDPVETGIGNFFTNLKFPSRFAGNVLQGKFGAASKETGKFLVNTTIGVGGILNPAAEFEGLQTPKEDIGQAIASWGVGHGFYVVLPFIGPTSLRDFVTDFADDAVEPLPEPWTQVDDATDRLILRVVEMVNSLPAIMHLYDSMKRSAIDPYSSVRDAYAQRRAREVAE